MSVRITRRRAIAIFAAAAGLPLMMRAGSAQARLIRWEGTALGAPASIQLYHNDEAAARAAIAAGVKELERIEAIFSLYRADSTIAELNRSGAVSNAPAEFVALAADARRIAEISGGAFDPTVQPVWQLYFSHFTGANPDPSGPSAEALAAALALVDWTGLDVDQAANSVRLARPGMGLTLNGMAQGFITDRVADVLRSHGLDRMLVDMGEPRALSTRPDGTAWRIGVADPRDPNRAITEIEAIDLAVATSGGYGTLFDGEGRFTHLIDPRTGLTAPAYASVTVVAPSAEKADALSTALSVAPADRRQAILAAAGGVKALFVSTQGVVETITA